MTLTAETSTTSKLALVAKGLSDDGGQEVATFGKALFADVDATELNAYSEQDLMKFAAVAFDAFRQRKPHEIKIVHTPFPFATGQILVVDIVNDDMPFLLDSVLG